MPQYQHGLKRAGPEPEPSVGGDGAGARADEMALKCLLARKLGVLELQLRC